MRYTFDTTFSDVQKAKAYYAQLLRDWNPIACGTQLDVERTENGRYRVHGYAYGHE